MNKLGLSCALCALLGCTAQSSDGGTPQPMGFAGSTATPGPTTPPAPDPMLPVAAGTGSNATAGTTGSTPPIDPPAMPPTDPPDPPDVPMDPPEPELEWTQLISAPWELGGGEETTYCQRVTLTEDVFFKAIRALNPPGTHHTATTAGDPSAFSPDGLTRDCGSALSPQGIFGSGVGTDTVIYPPGVGLRLRAGQQVLLNLHVYNSSDQPLTGESGTEVAIAEPEEIEHVAESLLAGPALFTIPAGEMTTVKGTCTVNANTTLFAVQPHMHQLGVHMKGVAHTAAGETLLHDGPFEFENQVVVPIEELQMEQGDTIDVECTFNNTLTHDVRFGESSDTEMCFLVLHRYPAPENPQVVCPF